jgi:hypothetical protein
MRKAFEFLRFFLVSVPLGCTIYVVANVYYEIKTLTKKFKK